MSARRITRHDKNPPLPQRAGIDPVALLLPHAGESPEQAAAAQPPRPTDTFGASCVFDYLVNRFYPHDAAIIRARFNAREVRDSTGADIAPEAPLVGQKIWYYRELPTERAVPFDMPVLYEDEWVLAVDKPHFLPTTPNGSFVAHTALTQLRVREENPLLIPIHRLDRPTAGVVLFAKTVEARAPFQLMFQNRLVSKTYEAVAAGQPLAPGESIELRTRIEKEHGKLQVSQTSAQETAAAGQVANAHSRIACLATYELPTGVLPATSAANPALPLPTGVLSHYLLEPITGKTHQLRAHLWALGTPIAGDVLYPQVLPVADDEPELPLQLLARTVSFTHPITGEDTLITSKRQLLLAPENLATRTIHS
ncbi:pseudouridine synthase [Rothia sp. ZJ932]|uniref:pseudouridine synthase n=1 Tax=Rothia sp. ZJ932 TaxID=2810516 RepID=UPI001966ECFC|nr:pseudouridine synthase [Rothia sp. ZJ932]QRZ61358.1 pseudouridylate synthase [Rothia sp. ZJ932]